MPYTKTTWVNGVTKLNATNMNKIEDGIFNAVQFIETPTTQTTTLNSTTPIVSVTDSVDGMADVEVGGATLNQVFGNGDFASGTTGLLTSGSTLSVTNKVLSVVGNGTVQNPAFAKDLVYQNNLSYLTKFRVRVTNSVCSTIRIFTGSLVTVISSPVQNQWYDVFVKNTHTSTTFLVYHYYADAATANGKVMEVEGDWTKGGGVFAVPITGTPYESVTADQINNIVGEYWEGLKSTERVDVVTSGRNLFDGEIVDGENISTVDGIGITVNATRSRSKNFTRIKPSTQYKLINYITTATSWYVFYYDKNKNYISQQSNASLSTLTLTTPSNAFYLRWTVIVGAGNLNSIGAYLMLNEGSTALPYQPYDGSKLTVRYTDRTKFDGALLPNGRDNEVNISRGYISAVDRVQRYVTLNTDVTAITNGTNLQRATIPLTRFAGIKAQTTSLDQNILFGNYIEKTTLDVVGDTNTFVTDATNLYVQVALGTWANLAAAQTALTGIVTYYELASPIFIRYENFGTYGIEVDGTVSVSDDYTQLYLDNYNLLPPTPILYPTNIAASVQGLKNAVEILNTKVDTIFIEGQATTDNTGWTASGNARFPFRKNVAITGVAATHIPSVNFTLATYTVAENANIAYVESYDGGVTLYAETTPTGSVTFDYSIIRG